MTRKTTRRDPVFAAGCGYCNASQLDPSSSCPICQTPHQDVIAAGRGVQIAPAATAAPRKRTRATVGGGARRQVAPTHKVGPLPGDHPIPAPPPGFIPPTSGYGSAVGSGSRTMRARTDSRCPACKAQIIKGSTIKRLPGNGAPWAHQACADLAYRTQTPGPTVATFAAPAAPMAQVIPLRPVVQAATVTQAAQVLASGKARTAQVTIPAQPPVVQAMQIAEGWQVRSYDESPAEQAASVAGHAQDVVAGMWARGQINLAIGLLVGLGDPARKAARIQWMVEMDQRSAARGSVSAADDAMRADLLGALARETGIDPRPRVGQTVVSAPSSGGIARPVTVQKPAQAAQAPRQATIATPAVSAPPPPVQRALPAPQGQLVSGDWSGLWRLVQTGALTEADATAIGQEWIARMGGK